MSKVYFTNYRVSVGDSRLNKMMRLIKAAGIEKIDFKDKFVAIKVHFGEWGNLGHIRQQYSKVLGDYIKSKGGKPFLTDCSTLYVGYRNNALDHLDCAYMNGYNPLATGMHTIIADGIRGTDERKIPLKKFKHCKAPKIGASVAEADIIIAITHCKGHQVAGYGGILKNIGMGCGSKSGKMEMHSNGTPLIIEEKCIGCGSCVRHCLNDGVRIENKKAVIQEDKCLGCGNCFSYCVRGAINCKWDEGKKIVNEKIAEYCKAVVQDKKAFYINFAETITKDCDCKDGNDVGMVPDIGMFAGFDPISIDKACMDAIMSSPIYVDSPAGDVCKHNGETPHDGIYPSGSGHNIFKMVHPDTGWEWGLKHGEFLGLGEQDYEIVNVK